MYQTSFSSIETKLLVNKDPACNEYTGYPHSLQHVCARPFKPITGVVFANGSDRHITPQSRLVINAF